MTGRLTINVPETARPARWASSKSDARDKTRKVAIQLLGPSTRKYGKYVRKTDGAARPR